MTYTDEDVERVARELVRICNDVTFDGGRVWPQYISEAHRILSALPRQALQDGWVCVPKEPTDEMLKAHVAAPYCDDLMVQASIDWRNMIAAAPAPPQQDKP